MIFLWIYLIGAVVAILPTARLALRGIDAPAGEPEPFELIAAAALGILGAALWPLGAATYLVYRALRKGVSA